MIFPKLNLHIHSLFSDGQNSIVEIVRESLKLRMDYIAITDHFTNTWKSDIIPTLNSFAKISRYLEKLNECRSLLIDKGENLKLYRAIEIDVNSSGSYIKDLIQPVRFDLILFEYLESTKGLNFLKNLINGWKETYQNKLPIIGLAHFDPSHFNNIQIELIIKFLKDYNIFIEFNSRYPQFYSTMFSDFFQKIRKSEILVAVGCDSHDLTNLCDMSNPIDMIKYYHLENNFKNLLNYLL